MVKLINNIQIQNLQGITDLLLGSDNEVIIQGKLSMAQVEFLVEALKTNTVITSLRMSNTKIGAAGVREIIKLLEVNHIITKLDLEGNSIRNDGAIALAKALRTNYKLLELAKFYNLRDRGLNDQFTRLIEHTYKLLKLQESLHQEVAAKAAVETGSLEAGASDLAVLSPAIDEVQSIDSTKYNCETVYSAQIKDLASAIESISIANIYDISGPLSLYQLQILAEALKTDNEIKYYFNTIYNDQIQDLESTINLISIDGNALEISGKLSLDQVTILAEALKTNNVITYILFDGNELGDLGVEIIVQMLEINNKITKLCLRNNRITEVGAETIAKMLQTNKKITHLNLDVNCLIRDTGAIAIAKALTNNDNRLISLSMGFCHIGNQGALALAEMLEINDIITYLDLTNNNIGIYGQSQIKEALRIKKTARVNLQGSYNIGEQANLAKETPLLIEDNATPSNNIDYHAISFSAQKMLRFESSFNYFFKIYGIELPKITLATEIRAGIDFALGLVKIKADINLLPMQLLESSSYYAGIKTIELLHDAPITEKPTDLVSLLRICVPELVNGAVAGISLMNPVYAGYGVISGAAQCLSKHNLFNEESDIQTHFRSGLDTAILLNSLVYTYCTGASVDKLMSSIQAVVMTDIATKVGFAMLDLSGVDNNIEVS